MNPTNLYIFTAIIATGIYDLFCVYFTGPGKKFKQFPSISIAIASIGPKAPWVYFVIGVACGHLFFNMCQVECG